MVRFDQSAELVFGERRIHERDRVIGGGRGKQADQRFATVAAEEKDEPLSLGGNLFGEPEARGSDLLARQPDVTAVVAGRRLALKRRDKRQKSGRMNDPNPRIEFRCIASPFRGP